MARTEHDRRWDMDPSHFEYPHRYFWGLHPVIKGWTGHLNPGLLVRLRARPPDIALLGGFAFPTNWLLHFWCPANTTRVMMVESNLDSARMMGRVSRWLKGRMLAANQAYIVPGMSSREYICKLAPEVEKRPIFELANLVDESVYIDEVEAVRPNRQAIRGELGVPEGIQIWVCPARLIEDKGLHLFLPVLNGLSGARLLIAGEGPMRAELEGLVAENRLPVILLGHQSQEQMVKLYAVADLFVLPSLREPYGLSAVEACAAGLPILVSNRVGAVRDVLSEKDSGWMFDPSDLASLRPTLRAITEMPTDDLRKMGRRSREIYKDRFESERCVVQLAEFFLTLKNTRSG